MVLITMDSPVENSSYKLSSVFSSRPKAFKAMAPFNGPTYNNAWVPPSENKPMSKA